MAKFAVSVEKIKQVSDHPNADRLSIAKVLGYNVIIKKDEYKTGDTIVYIPTQSVLPKNIIEELGLSGKLAGSKKNRVKEASLRGIFSEGLIYPNKDNLPVGTELQDELGIKKYEPQIPTSLGGQVNSIGADLQFNFDVENYRRFPYIIEPGEDVIMTEKIHGTCFIAGATLDEQDNDAFYNKRSFVGSKGLIGKGLAFKHNQENERNIYIRKFMDHNIHDVATKLSDIYQDTVYILGEVFGAGVQDLKYGALTNNEIFLRVFAIYTGQGSQKRAVNHQLLQDICESEGLPIVPILYQGAFSKDIMEKYTNGKESVSGTESHIREGVVITPVQERYDPRIGRVILKNISKDYLLRKGGTEYT